VLMKLDPNLNELFNQLVPDEIEEDQFWYNYFYEIEKLKS